MKSQFSQDELREKGIVVGFDARYNSSTWGRLTAQIFAQHGVKVRIFKDIVPTPYVAFNVRKCWIFNDLQLENFGFFLS